MKIVALDIPDDSAELGSWLERQLVGLNLGDLVTQLMSAQDHSAALSIEAPPLDSLPGDRLAKVLQAGLSGLTEDELRGLLGAPAALLELQERVFVEGGAYWDGVPRAEAHAAAAEQIALSITARLSEPIAPAPRRANKPLLAWAVPAVAASLLVGLGVWNMWPRPVVPSTPDWGFAKIESLTDDLMAQEYLQELALLAGQWSNKTPPTHKALRTRLDEFRQGCDALLAADHASLPPEDRAWLVSRCRSWRDQIIELHDSATSDRPLDVIQSDADALIRRIADVLSRRAESLG